MKTIQTNSVAVTIAKGLLGVFAVVVFMFAVLPTLSVYADESGDEYFDSSVGGDAENYGFYSSFEDTTAFFVGDSNVGGDVYSQSEEYLDVSVGGDIFSENAYTDSSVGGDSVFSDSTEIAYVVYEETSYPYYYDTSYNGYSGYSAGYSYTYPDYRDDYNYNYNYTYQAPEQSPTCTFSANRTSIDEGDDVRLTWSTRNATSISINNGVGTVSRSGSDTVSPSSSRTYTLVANGPGGSMRCSETILVDEDDNNDNNDNVRCDSFTASDTRVDEGDEITLRWRTTDANDVRINQGVGDVDDDGSERVTIDEDTTFTLTARDGSDTDTCRVTVRVEDDNDNDRNAPRCTLRVSDTHISTGESTILSWNNDRTDRMILRDDNGRTLADSDDDRDVNEDIDALTVRPRESTTYTLSVYNDNVRRTCELDVIVGEQVIGGVTLASVPYTGFDAGPVLTSIFYTAIVAWGLLLAYMLVIRRRVDDVKDVEHDWSLTNTESTLVSEEGEIDFPMNLPTQDAEVVEEVSGDMSRLQELEAYAHEHFALVSSDALRFIVGQEGTDIEHTATLDRVIELVKAKYPKEGEWVVINKERVLAVLA
ncbi:MAG: hypothetical protein NUW00_02500 [Candidatus Kaiserbacteria bacterium]|nr:hypothetical protein [Candidatus Kaiserbacteria bacterium]